MRLHVIVQFFALICLATVAMTGCQASRPPVTEVGGIVLLNGQPLSNAFVEFVPELSQFGAEMNSSGVTDDKGRFRLTCNYQQRLGAVVGKHRVTVVEAPPSAEHRGQDGASQERYGQYVAGLRNRPIPDEYGTFSRTPLIIEVTADKKEYELKLTRR
jgi:hypothetical protein